MVVHVSEPDEEDHAKEENSHEGSESENRRANIFTPFNYFLIEVIESYFLILMLGKTPFSVLLR